MRSDGPGVGHAQRAAELSSASTLTPQAIPRTSDRYDRSIIDVYLERGAKRTFACALDWPGLSRSGRDDDAALAALLAAAPRYSRALKSSRLGFVSPRSRSDLRVVDRLAGDASTDFGTPGQVPAIDLRPMSDADMRRARATLHACWRAFDAAVGAAKGKTLAKGPRGGGRDLATIVDHAIGADRLYIGAMGAKAPPSGGSAAKQLEAVHFAMLETIAASARGDFPERGPRGGRRWKARYGIRRSAWHWLDHAWEIEDRSAQRP